MRIPACALALVLVGSGCGSPEAPRPSASPRPAASPEPSPEVRGTDEPDGSGAASPSPGPDASPAPATRPDFTGTGCFPADPPTPVEVAVHPAALSGGRVRLTITIESSEPVAVRHRRGQEIDASVDSGGREIWRWSTVAPLVDPYGYDFTYESGDPREFSVVWDGARPGEYVVHGFWIADIVTPEPPGRVICFDDAALTI